MFTSGKMCLLSGTILVLAAVTTPADAQCPRCVTPWACTVDAPYGALACLFRAPDWLCEEVGTGHCNETLRNSDLQRELALQDGQTVHGVPISPDAWIESRCQRRGGPIVLRRRDGSVETAGNAISTGA